ncbi:MAG: sulfatase-like hydrolase/transferase [Akkermansiaceae bacterium]|nr:sulfatase-like hydrolase/transferase [Akkermansiaceae bacterium]
MRLFLIFLLAASCACAKKPNIVVVFIDDMGWGDFSCFGNTTAETDHIDRLAEEGLRFHHFYVNSPICSPSRTALTTGQYPQRWRITSYLSNRKHNRQRGVAQWLDPKAPTLPRILQMNGYATGHFGKWHMGGQRDVGDAPLITEYGFDESLTNFEGLGDRVLALKHTPDGGEPKKHVLGSDTLGRGILHWVDRPLVTEAFVTDALEFIGGARRAGKPFYINLWPDDVHTPVVPPLDKWGDGKPRTLYNAVLETMDEQLGVLFDRIRNDEALRDNTLVVVCSDNGPEVGYGLPGPFRGAKATLFEAGVRSPLVVWGPGLIPEDRAGRVNTTSAFSAMDLVPSLLAIAEVQPPEGVRFDGENLAGTLLGKSEAGREAPLFFRRPPDRENFRHFKGLPDLAVRDGKWKFYVEYDRSRPRLYDLAADQGEATNLAAEHPEVVARLTKAVFAWNAGMPADAGSK